MCRNDLKPLPACSPFNSKQDSVVTVSRYLQHIAYVVLVSRTASLSLVVISVTVKIQIGRMTMIDLGYGEEVVWGRFC